MIPVALPPIASTPWLAVIVEAHIIAGCKVQSVTVRSRGSIATVREWFSDGDQALAWALAQADSRHLPLFNLTGDGAD